MGKIVGVACTLITFIVLFAVLGSLEPNVGSRSIWAALFSGAFYFIFFRANKKSED